MRRLLTFFAQRENLSVTPDGLPYLNDRIALPPMLRSAILQNLHSGHLGVDKMKSLARMTCWLPEMNSDIIRPAKESKKFRHKKHPKPSEWVPWLVSCGLWQYVHADYCDPSLSKHYALVVVDAFSRRSEVCWTQPRPHLISHKTVRVRYLVGKV